MSRAAPALLSNLLEPTITSLAMSDNAGRPLAARIGRHPLVPADIPICGYHFDGKSGKLETEKPG